MEYFNHSLHSVLQIMHDLNASFFNQLTWLIMLNDTSFPVSWMLMAAINVSVVSFCFTSQPWNCRNVVSICSHYFHSQICKFALLTPLVSSQYLIVMKSVQLLTRPIWEGIIETRSTLPLQNEERGGLQRFAWSWVCWVMMEWGRQCYLTLLSCTITKRQSLQLITQWPTWKYLWSNFTWSELHKISALMEWTCIWNYWMWRDWKKDLSHSAKKLVPKNWPEKCNISRCNYLTL